MSAAFAICTHYICVAWVVYYARTRCAIYVAHLKLMDVIWPPRVMTCCGWCWCWCWCCNNDVFPRLTVRCRKTIFITLQIQTVIRFAILIDIWMESLQFHSITTEWFLSLQDFHTIGWALAICWNAWTWTLYSFHNRVRQSFHVLDHKNKNPSQPQVVNSVFHILVLQPIRILSSSTSSFQFVPHPYEMGVFMQIALDFFDV